MNAHNIYYIYVYVYVKWVFVYVQLDILRVAALNFLQLFHNMQSNAVVRKTEDTNSLRNMHTYIHKFI